MIIYFHVIYNLVRCVLMLPFVGPMAKLCQKLVPELPVTGTEVAPRYLRSIRR